MIFADFRGGRSLGLDLIRAIAILSVIIGHSRLFFGGEYETQHMRFFGLFGVELFFVLSGFLIGSILFRVMECEPSIAGLWKFWIRRWMRTLPLY